MCIRDSYKSIRQRAVEIEQQHDIFNRTHAARISVALERTKILIENQFYWYSLTPVSYTHLDVYKRQQYSFETFTENNKNTQNHLLRLLMYKNCIK